MITPTVHTCTCVCVVKYEYAREKQRKVWHSESAKGTTGDIKTC